MEDLLNSGQHVPYLQYSFSCPRRFYLEMEVFQVERAASSTVEADGRKLTFAFVKVERQFETFPES